MRTPLTLACLSACLTLISPATAQIAANPPVITRIEYDAEGQITRQTNALNQSERYQRDRLGHLTQHTDGANGVTTLTSDRQGNPLSVTAPNGAATTYTYDGFGNILSETSPDRGTTTYTRDPAGRLTRRTDARGIQTDYTYDPESRVSQQTTRQPGNTRTLHQIQYGWDEPLNTGVTATHAIGRLAQIATLIGERPRPARTSTFYDYHADGTVARQRANINVHPFDQELTTTWERNPTTGQITRLTYPSGSTLQYTYSATGQLTGLTWDGVPVAEHIEYEPFGPPNAWTLANGIDTIRATDTAGHPVAYTLNHDTVELLHDGAGRITTIKDKRTTRLHDYDAAGRLTTYTTPSTTLTYTYDANGNRTGQTLNGVHTPYTYAPNTNRLTHVDTQQLTYDAAGNLLTDGQYQYTYDLAGRLTGVEPGAIQYEHNGLGQRIYKRTDTGTRLFN